MCTAAAPRAGREGTDTALCPARLRAARANATGLGTGTARGWHPEPPLRHSHPEPAPCMGVGLADSLVFKGRASALCSKPRWPPCISHESGLIREKWYSLHLQAGEHCLVDPGERAEQRVTVVAQRHGLSGLGTRPQLSTFTSGPKEQSPSPCPPSQLVPVLPP